MRQAASVSDLDENPEHRLDQLIQADGLPAPIDRGPDRVTWRRAELEAWRAGRTPEPAREAPETPAHAPLANDTAGDWPANAARVLSRRNTGSGYDREAADFYREPRWCAEALFDALPDIQGPIYDPAAGSGNIPRVARARGYEAFGSDLVDRGCLDVVPNLDFLRQAPLVEEPGTVVSNPPYAVAQDWLIRSLTSTPHRVCLLLELKFLASQRRFGLFQWIAPLEGVVVLSKRPSMPPGHMDPEAATGGKQDFAWFVWRTDLPAGHRPWIDWARPEAT